jgi:hypothetical protein
VSSMLPNECLCSSRCFAYLDWLVLCLKALLCSLNRVWKSRPVCPTYAFWQSGHVSLYTPDCVYMFRGVSLWCRSFWIELSVRKAIFKLASLNILVICRVSLPVYVNVHHFCGLGGVGVCVVRSGVRFVNCLCCCLGVWWELVVV